MKWLALWRKFTNIILFAPTYLLDPVKIMTSRWTLNKLAIAISRQPFMLTLWISLIGLGGSKCGCLWIPFISDSAVQLTFSVCSLKVVCEIDLLNSIVSCSLDALIPNNPNLDLYVSVCTECLCCSRQLKPWLIHAHVSITQLTS